ncbi:hypothetical protein D3C75_969550 [compost metagenome]
MNGRQDVVDIFDKLALPGPQRKGEGGGHTGDTQHLGGGIVHHLQGLLHPELALPQDLGVALLHLLKHGLGGVVIGIPAQRQNRECSDHDCKQYKF